MKFPSTGLSFLGVVLATGFAAAQTADIKPAEQTPTPTVQELIRGLDADEFSARNAAAQQLEAAGAGAIPELEKIVREGSGEAAARGLDILRRHHEGQAGAVRDAAAAALERIAKLETHPLSAKAQEILTPPSQRPSTAPNFAPNVMPAARVQIQVGGVVGGARRIAIRNINGVKETEIQEGDRKLKLVQDPAKGIEIEVTEKQNGKETTKKYAAKDLDDLRKNHPEGAKAFDEIGLKTGGIRIAGGAAPGIPGFPVPNAPNAPAPPRPAGPPVEQLDRIIKSYEDRIQKYKADGGPNAERMIESLERAKAQIEGLKSRLPAAPK